MIKIILLMLIINNQSFANGLSISPIISKYENFNKKQLKKKSTDNLYEPIQKTVEPSQTENPYFIQNNNIRVSTANLDNQKIAKQVVENVEKVKQNDNINIGKKNIQSNFSLSNLYTPLSSFFTNLKINDEQVNARPQGMYKGFLMSFMMAGSTDISGEEERPINTSTSGSTGSNDFANYTTFKTQKTYLPSIELGIFVGWHLNSWIRSHLDLTWTYMYGNIGNIITQSGSAGSVFSVPRDQFDGNLFASTMNIFFDPYQHLKIWPTIGFGGGAAMFLFNNYNNSAIMWPVVNFYLGGNYLLPDSKTIISLGYKLQYIYTGTADNVNPATDLTGLRSDSRPTNQDNSIFFGLWIHKLELAIRFY